MSIRLFLRVLRSCLISLFLFFAASQALANTVTVAEWKFDPSDFYADSSGSGHFLNGNVASSTDVPTGSGLLGSASFDGTNILGVGTSGPINLSPYTHLHITWWQKVKSDNVGIVLESSVNYNNNPGAFLVDVNDGAPGTGTVCYNSGTGIAYDTYANAHGTSNDVWEQMSVDLDLATSNLSNQVVVSDNGTAGTDHWFVSDAASFRNDWFHIGGRWGDGDTHPLFVFTGLIADVKIEGTTAVPEPQTCITAISGILGLLCYVWCKRR